MEINGECVIGLEIIDEGKYFNPSGCNNCGNGLACDVVDVNVSTEKTGFDDYYIVRLCHSCVCAYYNGDPLQIDCRNLFEI